jgi:alpha-tubulin suppressor-like RCC1 family protein
MLRLPSLGHRFTGRSALTLLILVACSDTELTAPVVPVPSTPSELAGVWSIADSSAYTSPLEQTVCRNRGVATFIAGVTNTAADVRIVGTCISPRGRAEPTSLMEGDGVTVVGDSIVFTVATTSGPAESCTYAGRLSGGSSLGASGSVSCSRGRTGTWQMTWGPPEPTTLSKLTQIDIGSGQTCALDMSGQAWCWGGNSYGQLGTGDDLPRLVPAPVTGTQRFTQISVSPEGGFVCGVTAAGEGYCWGSSWGGRLADGSNPDSGTAVTTPRRVNGGHTFKQFALGGDHGCAITTAGSAYCWGYNWAGQLGTGLDLPSTTPVAVSGGLTFTQIDAYTGNTCGVTNTGSAYCWGEGWSGALGNGGTSDSNAPVAVSGGHTFASVSVGMWMACGVTTGGDGYCWGSGGSGLGSGTESGESTTPLLVAGGLKWKSIRAGGFVACGVTVTNVGYCWGQGDLGVLGIGIVKESFNRPVPISGGLSFDHVVPDYHACGLTVDGIAYCWSTGRSGQIGDGLMRHRWVPAKVAGQR